jgi:PAS domain S-box-containing protein
MATMIAGADGRAERLIMAIEDVTAPREAEHRLRESERQQAFALKFSDVLRAASDPDRLAAAAMRMIADHMHVDRCYTVRWVPETDHAWVAHEFHQAGLPALAGEHRWADFSGLFAHCEVGRPLVLTDAENDASLSAEEKAAFARFSMRGALIVLLRKQQPGARSYRWALVAGTRAPRQWSEGDRHLLDDLARRVWVRLDNARTAQELARSEAHYRLLFNSIDAGFCIIEMVRDGNGKPVDYRFVEVNPAFARHTGLKNALGRTITELVPGQAYYWFDIFGKVAATAEPRRFEQPGDGKRRSFDVYAFRVGDLGQDQVAVLFTDISERKRFEEHRQMLIHELNHRVKNTLAMVQALAMQTFRDQEDIAQARETFDARLLALSSAQDILTREDAGGATIRDIVCNALAAWGSGSAPQIRCAGPEVPVRHEAALALALALHELATNASKYGALSNDSGEVTVEWLVTDNVAPVFRLEWREHDGPPVAVPAKSGFGSRLIQRVLAQELGGQVKLTFNGDGVQCHIEARLDEISKDAGNHV